MKGIARPAVTAYTALLWRNGDREAQLGAFAEIYFWKSKHEVSLEGCPTVLVAICDRFKREVIITSSKDH